MMQWRKGPIKRDEEVQRAEKIREALQLRAAGMNYQDIADRLGYKNKSTAYRIIQKALEDLVKEPAEELRTLELDRLDRMTLGLAAKAYKGDTKAVAALLRVMDHRAKLTGLYEVQTDTGMAAAQQSLNALMQTIATAAQTQQEE